MHYAGAASRGVEGTDPKIFIDTNRESWDSPKGTTASGFGLPCSNPGVQNGF